jgi:hypothetical protein
VTCFGRKKGKKWSTATKGYVINTRNNQKKYTISHPHSITTHDSKIFYCDSMKGRIYENDKILRKFSRTYARGLYVSEKYIVMGVSSSRIKSKSSNKVNNPSEIGRFKANAGLIIIDRQNEKTKYYDLSNFEKEIFDVMILENMDQQRILKNINGISKLSAKKQIKKNAFITDLYNQKEKLEREVKKLKVEEKEVADELSKKKSYINKLHSSFFFNYFIKLLDFEEKIRGLIKRLKENDKR